MATYTSNYGWTKPSGSDNVDISVLNNNLDDQDSTIHDAFLNMAPPFSESSTYAVDDIVLYGTGLYKCHTAVVTPGSWTGLTNWQVYKLSEGGSGGGGTTNYNALTNKPQINSVELSGNKTAAQLGLMASDGVVANPTGQTTGTLTALEVGGTKYAVPSGGGGTSDYTDLTNKPSINGVTLSGNKTTSDLGITASEVGLGNVPNVSTNDQTPTFTEASTRNNIASGEKLSVIFGKIQKFFNDLKTVAFTGSFSDLINKPENSNTFQGTIAEWNQLTTAEKKAYDHASITGTGGGEYNVNRTTGNLVLTAGVPATYPANQVTYNNTDSGLTATDVQGAVDELASNKQNNVKVYNTQTYSGTTSASSTVLSLQLPAGTYMVLPAGYVNNYGAYIYKGTTGTGWAVNGTGTITLTATTTLNIGPAASSSTTWTNFMLHFLKIA